FSRHPQERSRHEFRASDLRRCAERILPPGAVRWIVVTDHAVADLQKLVERRPPRYLRISECNPLPGGRTGTARQPLQLEDSTSHFAAIAQRTMAASRTT